MKRINKKKKKGSVKRDIETRQAENAQTEMIKMCTIDGKKAAIKMRNLVLLFFFFFEIKDKTLYYLWNFKNSFFSSFFI